jgi:glucose/arabinose dehydrogenase
MLRSERIWQGRRRCLALVICGALLAAGCKPSDTQGANASGTASGPPEGTCPSGNGGLTLPPGFCATVFADSVGHTRDLVVAPNGDLFVNNWSGQYYDKQSPPGAFLVGLRDTKHAGKADSVVRFGQSSTSGGTGGTGIALYNGYLYAEAGSQIVRYRLPAGALSPDTAAEAIVTNLPLTGDHPMHPFVIDSSGSIYMDVGSASNSCQVKNRTLQSPGVTPCIELNTRAGIWKFDANKAGQRFSAAQRYVTGLRNAVGIAIDHATGQIYATQHGRDQLGENWPKLYTLAQSAELPAEEVVHLASGADFGWPECYFDGDQKKLVLAPEYGGDGGHAVGVCANKVAPVMAFPGHWAPDGLLFYSGTAFPGRYQGGAFIAFHGSWNRSVGPQEGYDVVFIPFASGQPSGPYEVFANGFAGAIVQPDKAAHRPVGLAVAPDGALFIGDDQAGRIWRVTYHGAAGNGQTAGASQ